MIFDALHAEQWAEALSALLFGFICFLLGIGYAIYRAVSWVERMRAWAGSVVIETTEDEVA